MTKEEVDAIGYLTARLYDAADRDNLSRADVEKTLRREATNDVKVATLVSTLVSEILFRTRLAQAKRRAEEKCQAVLSRFKDRILTPETKQEIRDACYRELEGMFPRTPIPRITVSAGDLPNQIHVTVSDSPEDFQCYHAHTLPFSRLPSHFSPPPPSAPETSS